jgi:polar amino acid transport system substrate-binding protein
MTEVTAALRAEFAPKGKLRVGLNMRNFLLTRTDPATGKPLGIARDLALELGRRLGLEVELVPLPSPGALAESAGKDVWDVGFLGAEPARANEIDFTAAYVEIESTYLVQPGSPLKRADEVDRKGVRIIVPAKAAYELYLTRTIKNAQLIVHEGTDAAFRRFADEKLEAFAALRPALVDYQKKLPGSVIVEGCFTAVQQAAGVPKGRPHAAKYLAAFIEDVKASGIVARAIRDNHVVGLTIAAKA